MNRLKQIGIFFPCVVEEYWRTPLLKALSQYCGVVFCRLVSPRSVFSVIRSGGVIKPKEFGDHLYRISLPLFPFAFKWSGIARLNQRRYNTMVARACQRLDIALPILWISHPSYLDVTGHASDVCLIYDCVDEFTAYPLMTDAAREGLLAREHELADKADLIFCVSMKLKEKMDKWGHCQKSYYFPNATSLVPHRYHKKGNLDEPGPQELMLIRRPIIGMTGVLNERVDFGLIAELARKRLGWSFVVIGPFADGPIDVRSIQTLQQLPNVHLLGPRPHDRLPMYIRSFDVCIIPYVKNSLNEHCSPLKMYDYLASGRPIVSSDISEAVLLRQVVRVANSAAEFEKQIEESLAESDSESSRRIIMARSNTWEIRAHDMFSVLEKVVKGKYCRKSSSLVAKAEVDAGGHF